MGINQLELNQRITILGVSNGGIQMHYLSLSRGKMHW